MGDERFYFGYGSNLNAEDWEAWCAGRGADPASMKCIGSAWLLDHSMRFHYRSTGRKGGAADVVKDGKGTVVPGALFALSDNGWELMDKKEGHPRHYQRVPVRVVTEEGQVVDAITYTVTPEKREASLVVPTEGYVNLIRDGLEIRNLPIEHLISSIEKYDSKSRLQHVFVYGTLMRGESRWPQLEPWSSSEVEVGHIIGRLYHLGTYPGVRLDQIGTVHGELHRCEDIENTLETLDFVEGHDEQHPGEGLFVRVPVLVQTAKGAVWAWTYVINEVPNASTRLQDGRWVS